MPVQDPNVVPIDVLVPLPVIPGSPDQIRLLMDIKSLLEQISNTLQYIYIVDTSHKGGF